LCAHRHALVVIGSAATTRDVNYVAPVSDIVVYSCHAQRSLGIVWSVPIILPAIHRVDWSRHMRKSPDFMLYRVIGRFCVVLSNVRKHFTDNGQPVSLTLLLRRVRISVAEQFLFSEIPWSYQSIDHNYFYLQKAIHMLVTNNKNQWK